MDEKRSVVTRKFEDDILIIFSVEDDTPAQAMLLNYEEAAQLFDELGDYLNGTDANS